jgi:hypothetical protein
MSAVAPPRSIPETLLQPKTAFWPSTELEVLLACCASISPAEKNNRIDGMLGQQIDWQILVRLAERHHLLPQLYREIDNAGELPRTSVLRTAYRQHIRRSILLTHELIRVVRHLESRGIQTLPYKGPILAQMLYGDVTARQFADMDILVRPEQVADARAALSEIGYASRVQLTERQQRAHLASGYEYSFSGTLGNNILEIQWNITPRFYSVDFDIASFFKRSVEIKVSGEIIRTLANEDLFLVLCIHTAKHAWNQISLLADIAALLNSRTLQWDRVFEQALDLGICRIVGLNLLLAERLLGVKLPAGSEAIISGNKTQQIAEAIRRSILKSENYNPESVSYFRLMAHLRERPSDRVRFFWRLLTTSSVGEWSSVNLSDPLFPLYRLVRLWRLGQRTLAA